MEQTNLTPVHDGTGRLVAYVNPVQPEPRTVVIDGEAHVLHPVGMPATMPPEGATMRAIIAQERALGRLPMWTGRTPALCYAPDDGADWEPVVENGEFLGYRNPRDGSRAS